MGTSPDGWPIRGWVTLWPVEPEPLVPRPNTVTTRAWTPLPAAAACLAVVLLASTCSPPGTGTLPRPKFTPVPLGAGIHKIKHVVVIMQENHSFDSYFGTYPGAVGIPLKDGQPVVCSPDPRLHRCIRPYHAASGIEPGGPHTVTAARGDINGGKMNGFVSQAQGVLERYRGVCKDTTSPLCSARARDVMSYVDAREIPNYWTWANDFVLQDHMFEPNLGWSLPSHLFMVSGWSASCSDPRDPMSCRSSLGDPDVNADRVRPNTPGYAWTDLTYLLHRHHVSWAYYVDPGTQPDCDDGQMTCASRPQQVGTPEIWNPLPDFVTVHQDGQIGNIQPSANFFTAARAGTLPAVSWVVPNRTNSGHWPEKVVVEQAWVTSLVDSVMQGPDWSSTAIFLAWDDWGGLYDNVMPPQVDANGYGLRVPGLVISPYARQGLIDHQVLSFDAYLKFIEDDFLGGERLDPKTDGRPDPRPTVREDVTQLGDLVAEFDFSQKPLPPLILPLYPPPGPASTP